MKSSDSQDGAIRALGDAMSERRRWKALDCVVQAIDPRERGGFSASTASRFTAELFSEGSPEALKTQLALGLEFDVNTMGEIATAAHRFSRRSSKRGSNHGQIYEEELGRLRNRLERR